MPDIVKRGFVPEDVHEFSEKSLSVLRYAQHDIAYLINRGYDIEKATTFIGNCFMLSARQRMALIRATVSEEEIKNRLEKDFTGKTSPQSVLIDGFNIVITLEAALSGTTILLCMDGAIRDLCGLRGTYRLIDKTDAAILLIFKKLKELDIKHAFFYFDAPVSNSGRLKSRVLELSSDCGVDVGAELVKDADSMLWDKENIISGDGIVLNRCKSFINLSRLIIMNDISNASIIALGK